ncbi:uncharacterized protein LOC117169470 [Belonocnema kinseyi]|uniref:uncharacterized protein LOC117169470 n=1 Tax=Belonocnema kinseyi TaxID=2817044 RepID=UPI00143D182A|nr:uncharacterized protein LOC117169470 [Belonocnema kinseyi]
MDFVLPLLIVLLQQEVGALKLLQISVPPYAVKSGNALLQCSYDLESDTLYSVSWYKDNEAFYTYKPKSDPKQHSYVVEGVRVDLAHSNHQKVHLRHVELHTAGRYKCEVSADAPKFLSLEKEAFMEVVVLPQEGPMITGQENIYASGDTLALNCTSGRSYPQSLLRWFINGIQVKPDSEMIIPQQHGLYIVKSSLRLEVGPHHLASGQMKIRCESAIQATQMKVPLINLQNTEILVQGHASIYSPSLSLLIIMLLVRQHLVH